jgi:DNA-binding XRE family transcriptional regulator
MPKISLKAARTNAELSQKAAAKILGVSNKTLHSWENGETSPSAKYIDAICDLYKLSYDDINFLPTNSLKGNQRIVIPQN